MTLDFSAASAAQHGCLGPFAPQEAWDQLPRELSVPEGEPHPANGQVWAQEIWNLSRCTQSRTNSMKRPVTAQIKSGFKLSIRVLRIKHRPLSHLTGPVHPVMVARGASPFAYVNDNARQTIQLQYKISLSNEVGSFGFHWLSLAFPWSHAVFDYFCIFVN